MADRDVLETLVIGGGPAGGMAAALLAASGQAITLVEKSREAHEKVCGDFLSGEAARPLARIGLDPLSLGAVPIDTLRIALGRARIETPLPFPAYGLSRAVLDDAILTRAAMLGADIRRGMTVKRLHQEEKGVWCAVFDDERVIVARRVYLATGKSDLRGHRRKRPSAGGWIGLKMPFRLSAAARARLGASVELHLFRGFYAGLQALPHADANLCLAIPKARFAAYGGRWEALLDAMRSASPLLNERLSDATPLFAQPLAVAEIPYGYVTSSKISPVEFLRLGDQAAVVPSFTGDGVAMALRSAEIAADGFLKEDAQARIIASHAPIVVKARMVAATALSPLGQRLLRCLLPLAPSLAGELAKATRVMRVDAHHPFR